MRIGRHRWRPAVTVVNSTTILTVDDAGARGGAGERDGDEPRYAGGTLANAFTYVVPPPPTVTGVTPASGPTARRDGCDDHGHQLLISAGRQ